MHLSRPFRGSFADFLGNLGAHIVTCNHVYKHHVPFVPKFYKHRPTCHEKNQNELSRPFAQQVYFRDLSPTSISLSQKCCKTTPYLKRPIEFSFFVAHLGTTTFMSRTSFLYLPYIQYLLVKEFVNGLPTGKFAIKKHYP